MVSIEIEVPLIQGRSGEIVVGVLKTLTERHLEDYERYWKPLLEDVEAADQFFEWEWKQRILVSSGEAEGYAIECEEMTQGLMILRTRGKRSVFDERRRMVYVSRLATAPWNRTNVQLQLNFEPLEVR
jgi:hypothetical protein